MYMYLRANLFIIVYTILVPDVSHDFWSFVKRKSKVFRFLSLIYKHLYLVKI